MDGLYIKCCSICVCFALLRSETFIIFYFWLPIRYFPSPKSVVYNSYRFLHHFCCFLHCFRAHSQGSPCRLVTFCTHKSQEFFEFSCCYSISNTSCIKTSKMPLSEFGPTFRPICINSRPRSGVKFWILSHLKVVFFLSFERPPWSRPSTRRHQL